MKYIYIFLSSILLSFMSTLFIISANKQQYILTAFVEFLSPFINLIYLHYMIESKDIKTKLRISFASGLGFMVGSLTSMFIIKLFYGN